MNDMPVDWLDQLKAGYPKRSGPMSWPRVFLKARRALFETSWDQIMEGVKRYGKYCQDSGIEGSAFVLSPARFFEDEIYLEELTYQAPEDPKVVEHRRKQAERWARASERAGPLCVQRYATDSIEGFEQRIRDVEAGMGDKPVSRALGTRISQLAERLRK